MHIPMCTGHAPSETVSLSRGLQRECSLAASFLYTRKKKKKKNSHKTSIDPHLDLKLPAL